MNRKLRFGVCQNSDSRYRYTYVDAFRKKRSVHN
ncbi:MAG: integrase DNA-binding domain-containing protein [Ruminococcus sp.]|nr:integrase DNA-binding domain-containing protein [Ruminococcus sp.]